MLERPGLWLSAPSDAWPLPGRAAGGRVRVVLDAQGRELVGHVAVYPRRWRPWRRGRRFAAYEVPDASLVFTGRITGWPGWTTTVEDADGHRVALVRGAYVLSPAGGLLAYHEPARDHRGGRFLAGDGREVAHWRADGGGTLMHFRPAVRGKPFVKMGLLAAVLTLSTPAKGR